MAEYFTKDGDEFVKVEDNLLTQADVDKVVESRLERDRKKYADYDDLKEKASKVDSITEEYEDKIKGFGDEKSELEGKLKKANLETVKVKAIHEFKLSSELAEFVDGEDEATIRAKAEKLSKGTGGGGFKIDKSKKPDDKASDSKKIAQDIFGKKSDD